MSRVTIGHMGTVLLVGVAAFGSGSSFSQAPRTPAPSGRAPLDPALAQSMTIGSRAPVLFVVSSNRYTLQSKSAGGKKQTISIDTPPDLQNFLVYAYRLEERSNIGQSNRWSISRAYDSTAVLTLDVTPNCVTTAFGIPVTCSERGSLEVDITFYMYKPVSVSNEEALRFIEVQRQVVPTTAGRGRRVSLLPWPAYIGYRDLPPTMSGGEKRSQSAEARTATEEEPASVSQRNRGAAEYIGTEKGDRCSDAASAQWIGLRNRHSERRIVVTYEVTTRNGTATQRSQDTKGLEPGASVILVCSVIPGSTFNPNWTYGSVEVRGARFD
jgi:hypothetical protein